MELSSDGYFALLAFGLSVLGAEVLLGSAGWRATLQTRLMVAFPLWATVMGLYTLIRMALAWGAVY